MSRYYFQGEQDGNLRTPWPVLVGEDGRVISGRPDAWALIGFQRGLEQGIARVFADGITDPDWLVGKFPIYSDAFGDGMFAVLERIERFEVWPDNVYAAAH